VPLRIEALEIDDANEDEAARHHVTGREMRQVLNGEPVFLPNKKVHAAPVVMIGRTHGGRLLTIPLQRTARADIWRPATAWEASVGEQARYRAAGGG
jgi:hypothetical protein